MGSTYYFQEYGEYLPKFSVYWAITQVSTNLKELKSHDTFSDHGASKHLLKKWLTKTELQNSHNLEIKKHTIANPWVKEEITMQIRKYSNLIVKIISKLHG